MSNKTLIDKCMFGNNIFKYLSDIEEYFVYALTSRLFPSCVNLILFDFICKICLCVKMHVIFRMVFFCLYLTW